MSPVPQYKFYPVTKSTISLSRMKKNNRLLRRQTFQRYKLFVYSPGIKYDVKLLPVEIYFSIMKCCSSRTYYPNSCINGFYTIDKTYIYLPNSKTVRDKDLRSHPQPGGGRAAAPARAPRHLTS